MKKITKLIGIAIFWLLLCSFTKGYNPTGYWVNAARPEEIILLDFNTNKYTYYVDNQIYETNFFYYKKNVELYTDSYMNFVFRICGPDGGSAVRQGWFIMITEKEYNDFYSLILNSDF